MQLAVLRPRIAILDELDSGLDIDALRACARRIEAATEPADGEPGLGVLAITHYNRLLAELRPDQVHILVRGQIVAEGGPELADELEASGYAAFAEDAGGRPRAPASCGPARSTSCSPERPGVRSELMPTDDAWVERDGALRRRFQFADFSEAFAFMTRVALLAEAKGHHPDWSNSWNTVDIALSTHSAGGTVTDRDRELAAAIDGLLG